MEHPPKRTNFCELCYIKVAKSNFSKEVERLIDPIAITVTLIIYYFSYSAVEIGMYYIFFYKIPINKHSKECTSMDQKSCLLQE